MRIPNVPYLQGRNSYDDKDDWKYGIAIHNTSNDASAWDEAKYAQNRTDGVSAHLYCDRAALVQSIDLLARTGHAGSSAGNENAISVEITGVNGWSRQTWLDNVAWGLLGPALGWCCQQFGIQVRHASVSEMRSNPKVRAFYSHDDMRQAWGGTDHNDPGPNFPWDRLFEAVNAYLNPPPIVTEEDDEMKPALFHKEVGAVVTYGLQSDSKFVLATEYAIAQRWAELYGDSRKISAAAFDNLAAQFGVV